MRSGDLWAVAAAFVAALLLTYLARRRALARGVVDVPNARSSHTVLTPRGGGIAIVLVFTVAVLTLYLRERIDRALLVALLGGVAIAAVGFADDHRPLRSSVRLLVHFAAAIWAVAWMGGLPPLRIGAHLVEHSWVGQIVAVLGIVWVLNLFNFMDGIDGIAALEAIFVVLAAASLTACTGQTHSLGLLELLLAAACAGFLLWNWPPARIFLGDVGSGYLGYVIAVLTLATARTNAVAVWVWLILGGAFFADATVTLVRRTLRGERVHEAHRSHAYQWLARRWGAHSRVTLLFLGVNLIWLYPCARLAVADPAQAATLVGAALLPVCLGAILAGAGRPERPAS